MSVETELEILEEVSKSAKFLMAATATPLLLIFTQLDTLIQVESVVVKSLSTAAIVCLLVALIVDLYVFSSVRSIILEKKSSVGGAPAVYIDLVRQLNRHSIVDVETLIMHLKLMQIPIGVVGLIGWLCVLVTVFVAVWS